MSIGVFINPYIVSSHNKPSFIHTFKNDIALNAYNKYVRTNVHTYMHG